MRVGVEMLGVLLAISLSGAETLECPRLQELTNSVCLDFGSRSQACRSTHAELKDRCDQPLNRYDRSLLLGEDKGRRSKPAPPPPPSPEVEPGEKEERSRTPTGFPIALTSVVANTTTLSGPKCHWKDDCKQQVASIGAWKNEEGSYQGVSVLYKCLGRYPWEAFLSDGSLRKIKDFEYRTIDSRYKISRDEWVQGIRKTANRCSNTLTVKSASVFKAEELDLESNNVNMVCFNKLGIHLKIALKYKLGHGDWATYTNIAGKQYFDCKSGWSSCRVPLRPALEATEVRLEMVCAGATSSAESKFNAQTADEGNILAFGFADTAALGKKIFLNMRLFGGSVPGLRATAFKVAHACPLPVKVPDSAQLHNWTAPSLQLGGDSALQEVIGTGSFGARFEGFIRLTATGPYTFYLPRNANAKLWLDNVAIVETVCGLELGEANNPSMDLQVKSTKLHLEAGFHHIRVMMSGKGGSKSTPLSVHFRTPCAETQVIPASSLFVEKIPESSVKAASKPLNGSSLPGMFGMQCQNILLPPCLEQGQGSVTKPVVMATSVVATETTLSGPTCHWKDDCKKQVAATREWRSEEGSYQGLSVVYDCLGRYPWEAFKSGGILKKPPVWEEIQSDEWLKGIGETADRCPNTLTVKSLSVFKAEEMNLKSSIPNMVCMNKAGISLQVHLKYRVDSGPWQMYTNGNGEYRFKCKAGDMQCTIPLRPALEATEVRLEMVCTGATVTSTKFKSPAADNDNILAFGFADTAALGKKVQLSVQFRSAMSSFAWTPVVKDEILDIMALKPEPDCTKIMQSCKLNAHWTAWKIPNYGAFEQSPSIDKEPVQLQDSSKVVWNVTVSKKRLVTQGESVIEKRMLCLTRVGRDKQCCVAKQLLERLSNETDRNLMAQARLENF